MWGLFRASTRPQDVGLFAHLLRALPPGVGAVSDTGKHSFSMYMYVRRLNLRPHVLNYECLTPPNVNVDTIIVCSVISESL